MVDSAKVVVDAGVAKMQDQNSVALNGALARVSVAVDAATASAKRVIADAGDSAMKAVADQQSTLANADHITKALQPLSERVSAVEAAAAKPPVASDAEKALAQQVQDQAKIIVEPARG